MPLEVVFVGVTAAVKTGLKVRQSDGRQNG
jgi:hypothetical protein